ncbi:alpha-L-arabinofuranosidase C-terminal domain-containing protein [Bifidobacterium aerophilum]|nr:alpha-L-arabinofuranosidase C-terminal domain-containing protein [Bifidobacterium aerophilum]
MSTQHSISIHTDDRVKEQGDLFGVFFEDLNHAADGGLYAELVRNRSFEFDPIDNPDYTPLTGWTVLPTVGGTRATVADAHPLNANNQHYLVLGPAVSAADEPAGISNDGFNDGIPVQAGKRYRFSCWARIDDDSAASTAKLLVELRSHDLTAVRATESFAVAAGGWSKFEAEMTADHDDPTATLVIHSDDRATLDLDMVSLLPIDTFDDDHVLRRDLAKKIADLKPRFVRFPGGCLIHDGAFDPAARDSVYRWKFTVGPVEERPSKRSRWKYNQTFGLGFYEYFRLCEQIGAEPIPVISLGCNSHDHTEDPIENLQSWIDDALDVIEFANGPVYSTWGRVRADMGHPEPFDMKYIALGNEEEYQEFYDRYEIAHRQIHDRYPDIQIIGSAGACPCSDVYKPSFEQADRTGTPIMDVHFYHSPEWVVMNAYRYHSHPYHAKVFIGEYATLDDTWFNALAEAAFMTGLERTPAVAMACYAPLLNNVKYRNWDPVLIDFDGQSSYGTPDYYVQRMFSRNQGTSLLGTSDDIAHVVPSGYPVDGAASIAIGDAGMTIDDLTLTDLTQAGSADGGGVTLQHESHVVLAPDGTIALPLRTDGREHFRLEFDFVPAVPADPGSGGNEMRIRFAGTTDEDYAAVTINGWWGRALSLRTFEHGKESYYAVSHIKCLPNVSYHALMEVDHGTVSFALDGERIFRETLLPYEPDDLYYSAVRDADDTVTVKLVNVKDTPADVRLTFDHAVDATYSVEHMDGFSLDAKNDFEHPARVSPSERTEHAGDGVSPVYELDYPLPAHAVHVLKFRLIGEEN